MQKGVTKTVHGCYGNSAANYLNARDKMIYKAHQLPEQYQSELNKADWAKHGARILKALKLN